MSATPVQYQKSLLTELVTEAADEDRVEDAESEDLKASIRAADSMDDIDECWARLGVDHDLVEPIE